MSTDSTPLLDLLAEARDLLVHNGSHVRRSDGDYPLCAGCVLEARIDEVLDAR